MESEVPGETPAPAQPRRGMRGLARFRLGLVSGLLLCVTGCATSEAPESDADADADDTALDTALDVADDQVDATGVDSALDDTAAESSIADSPATETIAPDAVEETVEETEGDTTPVDETVGDTTPVDETVGDTTPVEETVGDTTPVEETVGDTVLLEETVGDSVLLEEMVGDTVLLEETACEGACPCPAGLGDCDLDPTNGCETPLDSDTDCGRCGWVCVASRTCSAGTCECVSGLADCNGLAADGCEADLARDVDTCGTCDIHCGARATCQGGRCACNAGFGDCNGRRADGCETYLVHDDAHCGACDRACGDHQVCAAQRCACVGGFGDCNEAAADGCETSLTTDADCGSCGAPCPDGTGCAADACVCDPGRLDCNGVADDGCEIHATEDLSNCGRCGNICPRGQTCSATGCVAGVADLAMTRASLGAASVKIGTTLEVTNTLVNNGNAVTTAGYIEVAFYASTDDHITSADRMLGTRFTNILAPGGASTAVTGVTIPKTLEPGIYYIGAVADYSAQQAESDEGNNTLTEATVEIVRDADLVMADVSLPVAAVGLGSAIDITNTMANQGSTILSAPYAEVALYLSEDPAITMSDTRLATRFLWFLDPGASSTVVTPGVVPANMVPGLYYLGAIADYSGLQPEPNESNNALAGAQVEVYRDADLVIEEVTTATTRIKIGETLAVTNTVRNRGTTYASNAYVEVALYLSSDATITTADRAIGSRYTASLAGGGASTAVTTVYVPASVEPGRYYLGAIADPNAQQPESDETNNATVGTPIAIE